MVQDPNPIHWGAMDRFQAHYIVRKEFADPGRFLAKTILSTTGHFAAKTLQAVSWNGPGALAERLNGDSELNEMILKQDIHDAAIFVEPAGDVVRIRNKWKNHLEFGITRELFDIYDRIAGHIKSL